MQPSQAATRRVRAWAGAALRTESGLAVDRIGPGGEDSADLVAAIGRQRVADLLSMYADSLGLPADVAAPIRVFRDAGRTALMVQVLELSRIKDLLAGAGLPWLSIKGAALAVQTTGDPSARGAGDLDIVVSPDSVEAAYRLLGEHGWVVRPVGSGRPDSWAWGHLLSTFNEMTFDGPGSTIDLHWRLDPTHRALPDFEAVFARRVPVVVAGVEIDTLDLHDSFTHACHHAAKDDWRWLRSLVDVHRLARFPEVWEGDLARVDLATLAVTEACLGLPDSVPSEVSTTLAKRHGRATGRALAAQDRRVLADYPFPAAQALRDVRYRIMASRDGSDLWRTGLAAILPVKAVDGLDDRSAWTAVPRLLLRRVHWLARRTVAWIRRQPEASVVQQPRPR